METDAMKEIELKQGEMRVMDPGERVVFMESAPVQLQSSSPEGIRRSEESANPVESP